MPVKIQSGLTSPPGRSADFPVRSNVQWALAAANPPIPVSIRALLRTGKSALRWWAPSAALDLFRLLPLFAMSVISIHAATFQEDFSNDPLAHGWQTFGESNLFHWNSTNQNLEVTWDSSQPNSYFYQPLGNILTPTDDFGLSFDLVLNDITNQGAFEVTIGFLNLVNATATNYFRGTGSDSPNLVEFAYFPAFSFFQPTISQVVVSTNSAFLYNHDNLLEMSLGDLFHVEMAYASTNRTLTTTVQKNGNAYGVPQTIVVPSNFDFRVATVSVSSYSDAHADGSIFAHGTVDNIQVTTPPPPVQSLTGGFTNQVWQANFLSRSNWSYTLERTTNFSTWTSASVTLPGNGTNIMLQDTNPPPVRAYYRVRAER